MWYFFSLKYSFIFNDFDYIKWIKSNTGSWCIFNVLFIDDVNDESMTKKNSIQSIASSTTHFLELYHHNASIVWICITLTYLDKTATSQIYIYVKKKPNVDFNRVKRHVNDDVSFIFYFSILGKLKLTKSKSTPIYHWFNFVRLHRKDKER